MDGKEVIRFRRDSRRWLSMLLIHNRHWFALLDTDGFANVILPQILATIRRLLLISLPSHTSLPSWISWRAAVSVGSVFVGGDDSIVYIAQMVQWFADIDLFAYV